MMIQNWPKTSEETEKKNQNMQSRIQLKDMILCNLSFF